MKNEYQANQIYSFEGRPQDPKPEVIITKIDEGSSKGCIYHCYLQGVMVKTSLSEKGHSDHVIHLPFSQEALDASLLTFVENVKSLPNYQEGYKIWLESFEKGKAGVFHIPIKMALDFLEQTIN